MIPPIRTTRIGERDGVGMSKNRPHLIFCPLPNTRCISARRLAQIQSAPERSAIEYSQWLQPALRSITGETGDLSDNTK